MARIPEYQPLQSLPAVRQADTSAIGRGLENLGEAAMAEAARREAAAREAEQRAAAMQAQREMAGLRDDWTLKLIDGKQAAPPGAPDFTQSTIEEFDKDAAARMEAVPEAARPWAEAQIAAERSRILEDAAKFEVSSRTEKYKTDTLDIVALSANAVRTNFDKLPEALAAAREAVQTSGLTAAGQESLIRESERRVAMAAIQGLNETDPHLARRALEEGTLDALLEPEDKNTLLNDNAVELRRLDAAGKEAVAGARADIADVVKLLEAGYDPGREAFVKAAALASGDARLSGDLAEAAQLYEFQKNFRDLPPAEMQNWVTAELRRLDDAETVTPEEYRRVTMAETLLARASTELARDPLSFANRVGVTDVAPLLLSGEAAGESIAQRRRDAGAVARHYGIAPRFFTAEEAAQVTAALPAMGADDKLALSATIAQGFGPDAPAVLAEIAGNGAPLFAHAGGLALGGNPAAARDIFTGQKILAADAGILPPPADREAVGAAGAAAEAFAALPGTLAAQRSAAEAIYAARAAARGMAPGARLDAGLWERANQEAAGAVYTPDGTRLGGLGDWNGAAVVLPPGLPPGQFEGVVHRLTAEDLADADSGGLAPVWAGKQPFDPRHDLADSFLVSVGPGLYAISASDPADGDPHFVMRGGGTEIYVMDLARILPGLLARGPAPIESLALAARRGGGPR